MVQTVGTQVRRLEAVLLHRLDVDSLRLTHPRSPAGQLRNA